MTLIEDYRDYILSHVDYCNPSLAESASTTIFDTIAGRKLKIITKIEPLFPNFFFFALGYSGTYKSVPLKSYVAPVLEEYKVLSGEDLILPSKFSVEGFIENLQNNAKGIIIRDEFTGLLKATRTGYQSELEFLSELYDGIMQKRYTKSAKLEEQRSLFVSLLTNATPYMFSLIDSDTFFSQGFGNRCFYDFNDLPQPEVTPEGFFSPDIHTYTRDQEIHEYAKRLHEISQYLQHDFATIIVGEASRKLKEFRNNMNRKAHAFARDSDEISASYYRRLPEMAIKLAGLHGFAALCEDIAKMKKNIETADLNRSCFVPVHVADADAVWALDKVSVHIEAYEKIKNLWKTHAPSETPKTVQRHRDLLLSLLKLQGGRMRKTELCKESKLNWSNYIETISLMIFLNMIKEENIARERWIVLVEKENQANVEELSTPAEESAKSIEELF